MVTVTRVSAELIALFRVEVTDRLTTPHASDSDISYGLTWMGDRPDQLQLATNSCIPDQTQFIIDCCGKGKLPVCLTKHAEV
jgi:hypothetical protein